MKENIKVLIVEDDPASMNFLEIILNKENLDYRTAIDGEEGLKVFKEYEPHIILSDINMQNMSGIELLAVVKKQKPQTIMIMLTAFNSEEYVIESMRHGANNYLKKPILRDNITGLLRKYIVLIQSRSINKKVYDFVQQHSFTMKIGNNLDLIPNVVNYLISQIEPLFKEDDSMGVHLGLNEIITNAVEHGNLNISYTEKTNALKNNYFDKLVKERCVSSENANKKVTIDYSYQDGYCEWIISDCGKGFNPNSIPNPIIGIGSELLHGRGIFISRFQFDELEYLDKGNVVRLRKNIK